MSPARDRIGGPTPRPTACLWPASLRRDLAGAARRLVLRALASASPRLGEALRYRLWIARHERLSPRPPVTVAATTRVSVVPADPAVDLRALAGDLGRQPGVEWELCPLPGQALPDLPAGRLQPPSRSGGHPLAAALQAATAEILVLVDPATRLAPGALAALAGALDRTHGLAYADVDHISPRGRRSAPLLKPAVPGTMLWSLDLLAPLTAFHRGLAAAAAVAIEGDAPALGLRLELARTAPRIRHVPHVLAHRELGPKAEPTDWRLAGAAAVAAVRRHVARHHPGWEVAEDRSGRPRLRPPLPDDALVSIIIPTRDRADLLRACVGSLRAHTGRPRFELLVVDTGSTEADAVGLLAELAALRDVRVLEAPGRFNWSAANNRAARSARGDVLLFLNNDTEAQAPGWLEELAAWALADGVGAAGGLLCRPDGTVQHAGVGLGFGGLCAHPFEGMRPDDVTIAGPVDAYRTCAAVTGACLAVARRTFFDVGGFSERFAVLFSDVEFCLRARARGHENVLSPHARLLHHHGSTRGGDDLLPPRDVMAARELFPRRLLSSDPHWSPHLSRWSSRPRLARPGEPDPAAFLDELVGELTGSLAPPELERPQPFRAPYGRAWERVTRPPAGRRRMPADADEE